MKKRLVRLLFLTIAACFCVGSAGAQHVGLKTNLLYGGGALTPNLGLEIGLGRKTTLDLWGAYNWFNLDGARNDNRKLAHWIAQPEFRYWTCETFNGHFFGVHAIGGMYNIAGRKVPMLFNKESRYEGYAAGGGLSYGYHWMWGKRWGAEFTVGAGIVFLEYDEYGCYKCDDYVGTFKKTYFGPTKAGITLVFLIN